VLVPGFGGGDWTLQHLAFRLRRSGYGAARCSFIVNAGCAEKAVARVERRVIRCSERSGRRVAVVGHSHQFDVAAPALAAVPVARAVQGSRGRLTEDCACGFTAAYTGVADYADNVEITGSHLGMAWSRKCCRAIAEALARPER
jgi:hypothetical protein